MTPSDASSTNSGPCSAADAVRAFRKTLLRDRICVLAESIRRDAAVVRRIDALRRAGCALHPVLDEMRALSLEAALADLPRVRRLVRRYRAMETMPEGARGREAAAQVPSGHGNDGRAA